MDTRRLTTAFVALILLGCLVGVIVPAGLGWDFANFYDAGRRVAAGQSAELYQPQNPIGGQPAQGSTGFFGAPISAFLYTPLAALSPEAALVAFKLANVGAYFLAFGLLYRFHRTFAGDRGRFAAWFAGLCLIFQPFWTVFRVGGQTTPFGLALLAAALVAHTRARFWTSATCVVLAVLVKPGWAPILLFLLAVSGTTFLWKAATVLLAAGVLSLATLGFQIQREFVELMLQSGSLVFPWFYNSSLAILIDNVRLWLQNGAPWPGGLHVYSVLIYVLQFALLALVVVLTRRGHRDIHVPEARRHFDFLLAILLFLFWSRTLWEHYLALLFVPLIYLVASRNSLSTPAWRLVTGIFALSFFQNLVFTNLLRGHVGSGSLPLLVLVGLLKAGPLLLMLAFLVRHSGDLVRSYAAWPPGRAGNGP